MPLTRYFSYVGGVLLALLFILDACFPELPVAAKTRVYPPVIRIYSDEKWPERIVYDTSLPTIVPIAVATAERIVPAAAKIAEASLATNEEAAFAMLPASVDRLQASNTRMPEVKPRHYRRIPRKRASAPRVAMARQPQFGWFGRNFQ
ncbi:MAG: hypothetical protein JWQ07_5271 [Ramlibacter sp.]|nr:hypothetical protein [Ramlibacter sp.]